MTKTYFPTAEEAKSDINWHLVDASGKRLGRLASELAAIIRGKNKPTFTPHNDCGDGVIVINAEKIALTGNKLADKTYIRHTQFIGGLKKTSAGDLLKTHPERLIEYAVQGMLPKSRLGKVMSTRIKVYAGSEHPHIAQQPKEYKLKYC